jgi:hypothetical protein
LNLDKYARSAGALVRGANTNYIASRQLFADGLACGVPDLYFPAAILGHHALEMYLKAALICEGMTIFDPSRVYRLDARVGLIKAECAWGHDLVDLAKLLATRRSDFDLSAEIDVPCLMLEMPMKVLAAFGLWDPFFVELRYPKELERVEDLGEEEGRVLDALVTRLLPFLSNAQ